MKLTLGTLAVLALLSQLPIVRILDNKSIDILRRDHAPDSHIVILAVDNKSIQAIGRWPWNRSVHADLIAKLSQQGASAVGIDITFSESQRAAEDDALASSLASASPIPITLATQPIFYKNETVPSSFILPLDALLVSSNVHLGHTYVALDRDGFARAFPQSLNADGMTIGSFADAISGHRKTNNRSFERWINLAGPAGTFTTYSVSDFLQGSVPIERIQNAIILIGATASDLHDIVPVPVGNGVMAGVEWHANGIDNIVNQRALVVVPPLITHAAALAVVLVVGMGFSLTTTPVGIMFALVAALVWLLISYGAYISLVVIPFFFALFASVIMIIAHGFYRWYITERERRKLFQTLQLHFSPPVLKKIMSDPTSVTLGGERREVTILFSDIRSFTTITEQTPPEVLSKMLQEYFTEMTEEVLATDGVIDKFIGDAVMAFWGAPFDQTDQADRAVRTAQGMMRRLALFQKRCEANGWPHVDIGIGVHSGPATVGNMGSAKRFDYTVIGDSVNLAARLESLNKEYKTNIIISEATKNKITIPASCRPLGSVIVKGKTKPVDIFTVAVV